MHKSYQSLKPVCSKLLTQRWDNIDYEQHLFNIANAKSHIDNKPPKTNLTLHCDISKLQQGEARMRKVEADNRILLEKMAYCMRTCNLDNKNEYYDMRSLNTLKRRKDLLKLTLENQGILKRLIDVKPVYSHKQWEDEWRENLKNIAGSAKYPLFFLSREENKKLAYAVKKNKKY